MNLPANLSPKLYAIIKDFVFDRIRMFPDEKDAIHFELPLFLDLTNKPRPHKYPFNILLKYSPEFQHFDFTLGRSYNTTEQILFNHYEGYGFSNIPDYSLYFFLGLPRPAIIKFERYRLAYFGFEQSADERHTPEQAYDEAFILLFTHFLSEADGALILHRPFFQTYGRAQLHSTNPPTLHL